MYTHRIVYVSLKADDLSAHIPSTDCKIPVTFCIEAHIHQATTHVPYRERYISIYKATVILSCTEVCVYLATLCK